MTTSTEGLPDPATIRSKGFTLKGALAFAETRFGPGARERLLEGATADLAEVLRGTVLASAWYPFTAQVALYEAIDRTFGKGDLALCREIGRYTAESEASALHKLILKFASLEAWLRAAGGMWGQYYSTGKLSTESFESDGGVVRITRFHPISKAFCRDFGGWLEKTAEISGKRGVAVVHDECLLDGRGACVYRARWRG